MRFSIILLVLAASTSGCTTVDCGTGTIEKNGTCTPADEVIKVASCGSGTVLIGTECVPTEECDPATTISMPDPNDPTKTICVGNTTTKGCNVALPCPQPAAGKQTICGQLYNIEDNSKFADANADGTKCGSTPTATGPCALAINPYDALAYGNAPTMTPPLNNGGTYIDNCGRYYVKDITQPSSPFIGLGIDDATGSNGPNGVTNTTGVAANAAADAITDGLEAWVAPKSTTDMWFASGGPPVSGGIYVAIYRTHKCATVNNVFTCNGDGNAFANQSGVTITFMGSPLPNNDYYFMAGQTAHQSIDGNASATGVNGTGLLTGASVNQNIQYSGTGGIADPVTCKWEPHAAASLPNIVFFQVYRPQNQVGHQCLQ